MSGVVVIGGSDAGISAALRARELDRRVHVTIVVADGFPNFSICGLPFFFSGEVEDFRDLAHRTAAEIEAEGVDLLLGHRARAVDAAARTVEVSTPSSEVLALRYDSLVLGTGASSVRPRVDGLDLAGVFFVRWMQDAIAAKEWLDARRPSSALIIGGGYIGLEMADALTRRGLAVTLVEHASRVLGTVDAELGEVVRSELGRHGVEVVAGVGLERIRRSGDRLAVAGSSGFGREVDVVFVATGVAPETALARSAGLEHGAGGAIRVDRRMATSVPGVYAAGDCAETFLPMLGRNGYLPLGTTAHKQGRVAGENAVGGAREFPGALGTQVVKVFGLVVARTGLGDGEARSSGFDPLTVDFEGWDHKVYYPGATRVRVRLTGDRASGRLLGAQLLGSHGAEVSKRVDVVAAALHHGMQVDALSDLDLSYTPPLSSPWDPVQAAAQAWALARRREP